MQAPISRRCPEEEKWTDKGSPSFQAPGPTIANSPTLVTGNKGRLAGDRMLSGRYEHLVPQLLHEPAVVRIRKYSAHPLEEDSAAVYHHDGNDYYEVELRPEDGPYPLPYVARRANGSDGGQPFEEADLFDPRSQLRRPTVLLPRRLADVCRN